MKKRVLVWVLILCLVATLIPAITLAGVADSGKYVAFQYGTAKAEGRYYDWLNDNQGGYLASNVAALYAMPLEDYNNQDTSRMEVAYCFNNSQAWPLAFPSKIVYDRETNVSNSRFTEIAANERYSDDLDKWIISVVMNGYPMDYSGFNKDENGNKIISDDAFRLLTQKAIWYFSDSDTYPSSDEAKNKLSDNEQKILQELITTKLTDSVINQARSVLDLFVWDQESSPFVSDGSHTGYQNLLVVDTLSVRSLTLKKNVVNSDDNDEFTFNINVTPASGNMTDYWVERTTGTVTNDKNGNITAKLNDGESVSIYFLGDGYSYSIEEADGTYSTTYSTDIAVTGTGTVDETNTKKVSGSNVKVDTDVVYTNTAPEPTGKLTIEKDLAGDTTNIPDTTEFTFYVNLTKDGAAFTDDVTVTYGDTTETLKPGTDGKYTIKVSPAQSKTLTLPAGVSYEVEEELIADATVTSEGETGTITKNCDLRAAFTNTYAAKPAPWGELTVTKVTAGDLTDVSADTEYSFSVKLIKDNAPYPGKILTADDDYSCDANGYWYFTLKSGESITLSLPEHVTYEVVETSAVPGNCTVTYTDAKGTIVSGETVVAAVTNTYSTPTGELTVKKEIAGDVSSEVSGQEYTVNVTLKKDGVKYLEPVPVSTGTTLQPNADGVVTFGLKKDESLTLTLPKGVTYVVEETNVPDNCTPDIEGAAGTITANGKDEAVITNIYAAPESTDEDENGTGSLTVRKEITGKIDGLSLDTYYYFTVKLTDKDGAAYTEAVGEYMPDANGEYNIAVQAGKSMTLTNLPAGVSYTVTETSTGEFTTKYEYSCKTDNSADHAAGTIIKDHEEEVVVVNNYPEATVEQPTSDEGTLTVTKYVAGDTTKVNKDTEYSFKISFTKEGDPHTEAIKVEGENVADHDGTITFTLKAGETKTFTLPAGVKYTVVETNVPTGVTVNSKGTEGLMAADGKEAAEFTNAYPTSSTVNLENINGTLSVKKVVAGETEELTGNEEYSFTLKLTSDGGNYTKEVKDADGNVYKPVDGVITFKLKAEQVISFEIPDDADITYEITEDEENIPDTENFEVKADDVDYEGCTGTIYYGHVESAVVTNKYTAKETKDETPTVTPTPTPTPYVPSVPVTVVTTPTPTETPVETEEPNVEQQETDETPEATEPVETEAPTETEAPAKTETKETSKLPQTGVDWLPVVLMFIAGAMFITIGIIVDRRRTNISTRKNNRHTK
jgi:TQXA domain-containing protein